MITIRKVRFKNFLATGRSFIEVDLSSYKTTLIVGHNGAGKSTLLDALSFGLFNKPFREVNKGQVVNTITKKDCVVEVELENNGKEYLIRRGIKPNIFQIFIDGTEIPSEASATDFQVYLENHILQMNYKSFIQVVMLGSALFIPFMKLKTAQRREVVEDLLDLQVFSQMNVLLKDSSQELNQEHSRLSQELTSLLISSEMYHKAVKAASQSRQQDIDKAEANIANYEADVITYEKAVKDIQHTVSELIGTIKDRRPLDRKAEKLREMLTTARVEIRSIEDNLKFYEANHTCPTCTQAITFEHKQLITESKADERKRLSDVMLQMSEKYDVVLAEIKNIEKAQSVVNDMQRKIAKHQNDLDNLSRYIERERDAIIRYKQPVTLPDFDLVTTEDRLKQIEAELQSIEHQKRVHQYAGVLLKDSGIKATVIKQYVPKFNELINKYLTSLDFFVDFHLDENFNEKIRSRHRDEFSYNSFSEGQKMRIDLALMFTWRAIARQRNSININVLILDEVLDSSLDYAGTEDFLALIKKLTSEDNVLVISHRDVVRDQFDRILNFQMVKNFTQMEAE